MIDPGPLQKEFFLQGMVENYRWLCRLPPFLYLENYPFLGHVGLCGTVCKTIFPNVSLIGVYEADRQLHCWCIDNNGGDQENGLNIR